MQKERTGQAEKALELALKNPPDVIKIVIDCN